MPNRIDPRNPTKEQQKILYQLLQNNKDGLSRKQIYLINGVAYQVEFSLSKASEEEDGIYEVRTKGKLGSGGFGTVKTASHRILIPKGDSEEDGKARVLEGTSVYKRLNLALYLLKSLSSLLQEKNTADSKNLYFDIENYFNSLVHLSEEELSKEKPYEKLKDFLQQGVQKGIFTQQYIDGFKTKYTQAFKEMVQREVEMLNRAYPDLKTRVIEKENKQNPDAYSVHIFTPFVPGKNLANALKQKNSNIKQKNSRKRIEAIRSMFSNLSDLHRKGILHSDIKPENLLYDGKRIYIIDFGLSRSLSKEEETYQGGTEGYMPPEVKSKGYKVDASADMYACGITMTEIANAKLSSQGYLVKDDNIKNSLLDNEYKPFLINLFKNLTSNDPKTRISAEQAEIYISLLLSKPFQKYIEGPESFGSVRSIIDSKKMKQYSLQDIYYLIQLNDDKNKSVILMFFDNDHRKEDAFKNSLGEKMGLLKKNFEHLLHQQVDKLIPLGNEFKGKKAESAVDELIVFIKNKDSTMSEYTIILKLAQKIENVLKAILDDPSRKKSSALVTKILEMDPLILEKVSPQIIQRAYELKQNKMSYALNSLFNHDHKTKPEIPGELKHPTIP